MGRVQNTEEGRLATPRQSHRGHSASRGTTAAVLPAPRALLCCAPSGAAGSLTRSCMAGTPLWPPASVNRPDLRAESKSERPREVWAVLRGPDAHDQPLRNTRAYTPTSARSRWNTHTSLEDIVELPTRDEEAEDVAVRSLEDNVKGLLSQAPNPRPTTHEFKPLQPAVQSSPSNFGEANHRLLADQKQVSMAVNHLEGNMGGAS
jgi:hypothetical protein